MDSVDSLDFVHRLSGHLPWTDSGQSGQCAWTLWIKSMGKVQWVHGQSPVRPVRLGNVHGLCPESPWTKSFVQRVNGQSPGTQWTVWTLSMDTLDKVCWVQADWTLCMDSLDFVQSDVLKKLKVKVAWPLKLRLIFFYVIRAVTGQRSLSESCFANKTKMFFRAKHKWKITGLWNIGHCDLNLFWGQR